MQLVNLNGKALTALVILVCIGGCQTTGDPKAGGLFGWSENKAEERKQELAQTIAQTQDEVAKSRQRNESLEAENTRLKTDKERREAILLRLIEEQVVLQQQLIGLEEQSVLSSNELAKIQEENPWLSKTHEQVLQEFREFQRDNRFQQELEALEGSNKKLTQEILLLIGR